MKNEKRNFDEGFDKEDSNAVIHIPELNVHHKVNLSKNQEGLYYAKGTISLESGAHLEFWSPYHPKRYEVEVEYLGDLLKDNIGFRKIEVKGSEIYLNGESIFLKGMCVHEESGVNLRSVSKEDIILLIKQAKELGCNFLRLTHYPHT